MVRKNLKKIEMVCRWLIYRGRENEMRKDTPHVRYHMEPPGLITIAYKILGRSGECDEMEHIIIRDVYPRNMYHRRRVQGL
jgi:hypothetical protein